MNPVVHFEFPAEDKQRMMKFYAAVFGWQMKMMGPDMGEYVTVTTTETDDKTMRPKTPGAINGGFYTKSDVGPDAGPTVVIAVDDIRTAMKKVTDAGGTMLNGPDNIPGIGMYASFRDTEGNRVAMLQPSPMM